MEHKYPSIWNLSILSNTHTKTQFRLSLAGVREYLKEQMLDNAAIQDLLMRPPTKPGESNKVWATDSIQIVLTHSLD